MSVYVCSVKYMCRELTKLHSQQFKTLLGRLCIVVVGLLWLRHVV